MKFRRRPIDRPVIDAIKLEHEYFWRDAQDVVHNIPHADFERDYELVARKPRAKPVKPRGSKKRVTLTTPAD